jgi:S1-C subfamily serine protease
MDTTSEASMIFKRSLMASIAMLLLVAAMPVHGSAQTQDLTSQQRERLYYEVKPAVVLVWASALGHINVIGPADAGFEDMGLPAGQPLQLTLSAELSSFGSGFLLSPDGYISTNAHVIQLFHDQNEQQLEYELFFAALENSGFFTRLNAVDANGNTTPLTRDMKIDVMFELLPYANVTVEKNLDVYLQNWRRYPAEVKEYSPPINPFTGRVSVPGQTFVTGKDIAVLKIEGRDFPTMAIGDSDRMSIGNAVSVAGYPGTASFNEYLDPRAPMQASFTRGQVSSLKVDVKGTSLVQIDAAITGGNSGGPVLSDDGTVVGMATMGAEPGFNFAVPTSSINEFIRAAGVSPQASLFDNHWKRSLDHYYTAVNASSGRETRAEYQLAINSLDEVLRLMPDLPDAMSLRQEALRRRDASPNGGTPIGWIGGALATGLALVGLGLWWRNRSTPAVAVAGAAGGTLVGSGRPITPIGDGRQSANGGRLTVTAGPLQGNTFTLGPQGLKIGRDPTSCLIVLTDPTVSREHAALYLSGADSGFQIKNLSGTNSTFVNDRPIQEATLRPGDRIKIGASVLSFEKN